MSDHIPKTLILFCASAQVLPTVNIDPPLRAIITDVDYDDILNQVPISEAVKYYGAHNLMANMKTKDVKEYLQP